ncbi:hypothetical protein EBR21_11400, partial [bacterium]|nr:hypothetical protein [bacterium]
MVQQQKKTIELNQAWVDGQLVAQFGVSPQRIYRDIDAWLEEDSGGGDVSLWTQPFEAPAMKVEIIA